MADEKVRMEGSQGESFESRRYVPLSTVGYKSDSDRQTGADEQLSQIKDEATRLRALCSTYRTERKELESTLATLKADVAQINTEKEEARFELVSEKEAFAWWAQKEGGGSSAATGSSKSGTGISSGAIKDIRNKADIVGKAIRRAHMFEGKVQEAEVRIKAMEARHKDGIEEERAVAAGLRDRIGRLEGRLRTADQAKSDALESLEKEKKERAEEGTAWKAREGKWNTEKEDLISLRDDLRGKLQALEEQARTMQEEKQALVEEGRKLRVQLEAENGAKLASGPLTPLQTNRPIPATPSRSGRTPAKPSDHPASSTAPGSPVSLARRLAYQQGRYKTLEADYEKLRGKHEADVRSWKEWKTAHLARQDEKKAKRAQRRAERISTEHSGAVTSMAGTAAQCTSSAACSTEGVEAEGELGPTQVAPTPARPTQRGPTQMASTAAVIVAASQESAVELVNPDITTDIRSGPTERRHTDDTKASSPVKHTDGMHQPSDSLFNAEGADDMSELPEWCSPGDLLSLQRDEPSMLRTDARLSSAGPAPAPPLQRSPHRGPSPQQHFADHGLPGPRNAAAQDSESKHEGTTPRLLPHASRATGTYGASRAGTYAAHTPAPLPQATRTTPWLGKAPLGRTGSSTTPTHQSKSLQTMDDDIFASPPEAHAAEHRTPMPTFSNAAPARLVRDRTGRTPNMPSFGGQTSLLRTALRGHGTAEADADHGDNKGTPSRLTGQSGCAGHTPLRRFGSSGSISKLTGMMGIADPAYSTPGQNGVKRKLDQVDLAQLDFADMTPQEKQANLKRLAHLPAPERREAYKQFKGKGRYLPPEQLQKGIADEYEIDPKLNEGHTHQFHDVKRKRSERKQMHGGDCECCRGYYEAIGDIPRFNQAPKWNDGPDAAMGAGPAVDGRDDAVHQHQQLVSRHREVWAVGSTPPGYWSIGFPSTQDAEEQNRRAEELKREKEARIRRDAEMGTGKYRKKAGVQ